MAGISKDQRPQSWNVRFMVGPDAVAGIFQRDGLLRIADVAHELQLCLVFESHQDKPDEAWQPALLAPGGRDIFVLDKQDERAIPTPASPPGDYTYVFHSSSRCAGGHYHSLQDACVRQTCKPVRRFDPRYMEIGQKASDSMGPLRRARSVGSSGHSISPGPSVSPGSMREPEEVLLNQLIRPEVAGPIMDNFRSNVLSYRCTCVFSGMGKSWLDCGMVGPGIEAAHIVPQLHWPTYPITGAFTHAEKVADPENPHEREEAWNRTWSSANGLPMLSHLHKCFDARIISIHPQTHRIRAFVDYDILTTYHGQLARLPKNIDQRALQHHWDMCCLENTRAWWLPREIKEPSRPLSASPAQVEPPKDVPLNMQTPDPSGPSPQPSDAPRPNAQGSYRKSTIATQPPSPPPSEPACERPQLWRFGDQIISDPDKVLDLINQGWSVEPVLNNQTEEPQLWKFGNQIIADADKVRGLEDQGWSVEALADEEGTDRGRPLKRRRCVATEEDPVDDSVLGQKRRKAAEISPDASFD